MIDIISYHSLPFTIFENTYNNALDSGQQNIEAMCLSTSDKNFTYSRMVNVKYILNDKLIFFSNYNSNKAKQIQISENVACLFFWPQINSQIRLLGTIRNSSNEFSNDHFSNRSIHKNALAISSNQSQQIESYEKVKNKYKTVLNNYTESTKRPSYWGGYEITPNYFEFWQGRENRLNKREEYLLKNNEWVYSILEP